MRFLVTAGPTREYFDTVRFVSNGSSGLTGFLIARRAVLAGHEAVLVTGPTHLAAPEGVASVRVVSAEDMSRAVRSHLAEADVLVAAAAVCDWRPSVCAPHKLAKRDGPPAAGWVRTPDILAEAGKEKGARLHIGFALEDIDARRHAREKLAAKNLDYLVLNGPENLAAGDGAYALLARDGRAWTLGRLDKETLAALLVDLAVHGPQILAGASELPPDSA